MLNQRTKRELAAQLAGAPQTGLRFNDRTLGPAIFAQCAAWRLTGFAWKRVIRRLDDSWGSAFKASFQRRYAATVRTNLLLIEDLQAIDAAFGEAGIRALVVKGMALVQVLYQDPGIREMSDIDVLVHPDLESDAIDVLLRLGYARDRVHPTVFTLGDTVLDVKPEPFGIARLAHRMTAFSAVEPELWSQTVSLDGYASLKTWSVPSRLYTLMIHALKHGFPDGVWLTDLGEQLKRTSEPAWQQAMSWFTRTNNTQVPAIALARLADWGYPTPDPIAELASRYPVKGTSALIGTFSRGTGSEHLVEALYLSSVSRGFGRIGSLVEAVFPNEAVYRENLPGWMRPFRHLIRIFDVLKRTMNATLHRITGA